MSATPWWACASYAQNNEASRGQHRQSVAGRVGFTLRVRPVHVALQVSHRPLDGAATVYAAVSGMSTMPRHSGRSPKRSQ
jgi:hypothetical protein